MRLGQRKTATSCESEVLPLPLTLWSGRGVVLGLPEFVHTARATRQAQDGVSPRFPQILLTSELIAHWRAAFESPSERQLIRVLQVTANRQTARNTADLQTHWLKVFR